MKAAQSAGKPRDQLTALEKASRHLLCTTAEADATYGAAVGSRVEDIDEWAHSAEIDLAEHFEVVWSGIAEEDLETLDRLAAQWEELPEEDVLLDIAVSWGALIGDRLIEALGGRWAFRAEALHHSVIFPRKDVAFFPIHSVVARFLLGESAGIEACYQHLVTYLTEN